LFLFATFHGEIQISIYGSCHVPVDYVRITTL